MSFITPQSRELVRIVTQSERTKAPFGGNDSRKFPSWWFDAITCIEQQKILEHNARVSAQNAAMRKHR